MTTRVLNLGSGSSGNALLIEDAGLRLLVDCGVGPRTITAALKTFNLAWGDLDLVLISHEHSDHVRALPAVHRHGIPLLCTDGTARASGISSLLHTNVDHTQPFTLKGATISSIRTSHDAADPCGYRLELPGATICVLTDTGELRTHFVEQLSGADLIVLEANHDEQMLKNGPYPIYLKRRVASRTGHLSNRDAGELVREVLRTNRTAPEFWLGHLSQTNNRPRLALETVRDVAGPIAKASEISVMTRGSEMQLWQPGERQVQLALSLL